jgi:hypothetical protein
VNPRIIYQDRCANAPQAASVRVGVTDDTTPLERIVVAGSYTLDGSTFSFSLSRDGGFWYGLFDPKFAPGTQIAYSLEVTVVAYDAQQAPGRAATKITMETICPPID